MNDDQIARALLAAGPRPQAPAEATAQVRRTLERLWQEDLARRRHRRQLGWGLAAALLLAAAGSLLLWGSPPADAAVFVASRGAVTVDAGSHRVAAVGGSGLPPGSSIRTGHDGFALLAIGPISLRIGPDTETLLQRADRLQLMQGRVYLDFGRGAAAPELRLVTALGTVQHLGTQFQAALDPNHLLILVREGQVKLATSTSEQLVGAQEAADVDISGHAAVHPAPGFGSAWDWVSELHPDLPIEGLPLSEFLAWFARETGQHITYDSLSTHAAARTTRLSGNIEGLSLQQALTAVLASTRFAVDTAADGVLVLKARSDTHAKLRANAMERRAADPVEAD